MDLKSCFMGVDLGSRDYTVEMKRVMLERLELNIQRRVSEEMLFATPPQVLVRNGDMFDVLAKDMIIHLRQYVAGEKKDHEIKVPLTWEDHLRLHVATTYQKWLGRKLTHKLLDKVKYKTMVVNATTYYPSISIPDKEHFVVYNVLDRY